MKNLDNRVAVITGAGSGIGQALARQLGAQGCRLALNDWNKSNLDALVHELQGQGVAVFGLDFDVSDRSQMQLFADQTLTTYGQVDIVVNNAGISHEVRGAAQIPPEEYERILGVNFYGVLHGTQIFMPYLMARPEASVVNISSVFGIIGYPGQGPYCASKWAVRGFNETLRIELADTPVQMTSVHPGGIRTNIVRNIQSDNAAAMDEFIKNFDQVAKTTSEQAAKVIIKGIQNKSNKVLIGPDARVIDWVSRIFPRSYENKLLRKIRDKIRALHPKAAKAETVS